MNIHDAGASNRGKYNTFPLTKLQPISDDEESEAWDYERMDETGQADVDCDSTPLLGFDHTSGVTCRYTSVHQVTTRGHSVDMRV